MEKIPEIQTVGNALDDKKEQVKAEIQNLLLNHLQSLPPQDIEQLKKHEIKKTEEQIALLTFVNAEVNRLSGEFRLEPYDIPTENYHIVPSNLYKKVAKNNSNATAFCLKQGIIFEEEAFQDNLLYFGAVALHETLHLKAFYSMEVNEDGEEIHKTPYREGITIRALQREGYHGNYHEHFRGLHEAIVSRVERDLISSLLELPELVKEKEWLASEEANKMKKKLAEEKEMPEENIIWVGKKGKNDWERIGYPKHIEVLEYVCFEIQVQFPDKYQDIEEVFKEFLKAHFNGQLLGIARLVEQTFGEGSFRLLGNMSGDKDSAVLHLESLRKARIRVRKQS
jgi:hypothetical protein